MASPAEQQRAAGAVQDAVSLAADSGTTTTSLGAVVIVGHATVEGHTKYELCSTIERAPGAGTRALSSSSFRRRYRDFDELSAGLIQGFPDLVPLLPRLPAKKWFGRLSPAFVETRLAGLQVYINALLRLAPIRTSALFCSFFEVRQQWQQW